MGKKGKFPALLGVWELRLRWDIGDSAQSSPRNQSCPCD